MSISLNAFCNHYAARFPQQFYLQAAKGFFFTTGIQLICLGSTPSVALFKGSIAVIASIFESVIRPFTIWHSTQPGFVDVAFQLIAPQILALEIVKAVAPEVVFAFQPLAFVIACLALFMLNRSIFENNVAKAEIFFF